MSDQHQIILLNGASSSGKTSLCKQLQLVLEEPYIHLEEDAFVFNTYHERFLQGEMGRQIFEKTMLGYYRSLTAFVSAGHNVLADTGLYTPALLHQCVTELQLLRVWLVGVHCALPELEHRERARGDRDPGLAKEQFHTIHAHALYDIEVDTSTSSLDDCAITIKQSVSSSAIPQAMRQLQAKMQV